MSVVAKISKVGFNALITDNKNLSFSSELATHSIYNIVSIVKLSGHTRTPFNHNLGYKPKVWIFLLQGTAPNDYLSRIPIASSVGNEYDYYITDDDIIIETNNTAQLSYKIVIFTRSFIP